MKINKQAVEKEMASRLLTLSDVAKICKISQPTLRRALQGYDVSPKTVGRIARGINIPIDSLVYLQ